jgi:hypothetical protein
VWVMQMARLSRTKAERRSGRLLVAGRITV